VIAAIDRTGLAKLPPLCEVDGILEGSDNRWRPSGRLRTDRNRCEAHFSGEMGGGMSEQDRSAYYGHPRREMEPFVPQAAGALLDVGCGAGAFAATLRTARAGRQLEIWGVELSPEAAARARATIDHVLVGDAHACLRELPDARFDCVVMNDVLEHLVEPALLLHEARRVLRPDGVLVASLPNVRYFFNVWDLVVRGRWDYTDEGILDRTHLRFFTRSSLVRLFTEAGFDMVRMQGINPTGSLKFKLANLVTLGRWADMRWLQFACVARPRRQG
jgi:2-polyprenyl-3-methyl-5-hydroxy-6-metoxy-1,4-benzoquinol methylase